jgi:hypothetical protein
MKRVVVEKEVVATPTVVEGDGSGTASSAIWAITMIIIVAIIAGVVYYSGVLDGKPAKPAQKINVEVKS